MKDLSFGTRKIKFHNVLITLSSLCIFLFFSQTNAFSAPHETAFSWVMRYLNDNETPSASSLWRTEGLHKDFHHLPAPGTLLLPGTTYDFSANHQFYQDTYDALYGNGYLMGAMFDNSTGPDNGWEDPLGISGKYSLSTVMGYVQRLDYVFGLFETDVADDLYDRTHTQCVANVFEMVDQVRNSTNSNINNAIIGSYGWMPGTTLVTRIDPNDSDRTQDHNDYLSSGLNCAMPDCYPYACYAAHTNAAVWGTNISPNDRSALFWVPLERYSTAKRALPAGHQIIPWVYGFVPYYGYDPTIPTRADNRATLQHMRLRGADGYYLLGDPLGNYTNSGNTYDSLVDYNQEMVDAWCNLDLLFADNAIISILNLSTNKTGGIEWSGIRNKNNITVLVSNLGNSSAQVDYPDKWGLPNTSATVAAGKHVFFNYTVTNMLTNGDFNAGSSNWYLSSATWQSSEGIGNTGCLKLQGGWYSVVGTDDIEVAPNEQMQISYYAKGQSGAKFAMKYYYYDADHVQLGYADVGLDHIPGSTYQKYKSTFTIPSNSNITYIRPILYNVYGAADPNDIIWIDDMVIKFFDPNQVEDPPLIHLAFNEASSSSTTADEMGNISDGTKYGPTTLTSGISANALVFDGLDDYVDFGSPSVLDITGSCTLSAWIKPDVNGAYNVIAAKYLYGYGFFTHNGTLGGYIAGTTTAAHSESNTQVTVGKWHHVAMTFNVDGDKKIRLYIDGMEVKYSIQTAMNGFPANTSAYNFTIGNDYNRYYFDGAIDEVKVYNRALSAIEINEIHQERGSIFSVGMDELAGDIVNDASIYRNNGTRYGASWSEGISGNALDFDGVDDYVDFGIPAELDIAGSRTMSAWIKPDVNGSRNVIVSRYLWGSSLYTSGGKLCAYIWGDTTSATSISNESIVTGEWQHVTMTFDVNGDKKIRLYINGKEVTYSTQTALVGDPQSTYWFNFVIGCDDYNDADYFDGKIDEVKVYDRALSPAEILERFGNIFSVGFNEGTGNFTEDSSINENGGTISGASWVDGVSGKALDFDGVDDYVDFGIPAELDLTGSRTMSAWIKPDVNGSRNVIVSRYLWGSSLYTSGGKLCAYLWGDTTSATSISNESIATGEWQHVAMTFDVNGDKKIHLYLNGFEVTYSTQIAMVGDPQSTYWFNFVIGCDDYNHADYFNGAIDEVKVYDRSLSSAEMLSEFGNLLFVDFNEGTGSVVDDANFNDNDGSIIGASWGEGISGNALDFDGVDDYVDFGIPDGLNLAGNSTISAWIKPDVNGYVNVIAARYLWGYSFFTCGGKLRGYIAGSTTGASSVSIQDITPGVWQHVAMTFNGTTGDRKIHLYINGVQVAYSTQTAMVGTPVSTSPFNFSIGCDEYSGNNYFDGMIDEVKIFDRAIMSSEVALLHANAQ